MIRTKKIAKMNYNKDKQTLDVVYRKADGEPEDIIYRYYDVKPYVYNALEEADIYNEVDKLFFHAVKPYYICKSDTDEIKSTAIANAEYDKDNQTLDVVFWTEDGVPSKVHYIYLNVSKTLWKGLLLANSAGKYLNTIIKPKCQVKTYVENRKKVA